jgi:hypothetical protein
MLASRLHLPLRKEVSRAPIAPMLDQKNAKHLFGKYPAPEEKRQDCPAINERRIRSQEFEGIRRAS